MQKDNFLKLNASICYCVCYCVCTQTKHCNMKEKNNFKLKFYCTRLQDSYGTNQEDLVPEIASLFCSYIISIKEKIFNPFFMLVK